MHQNIIIVLQNLFIFAYGNKNRTGLDIKKSLLIIIAATSISSCCTVFTASKQNVTFMAPNGTKIYDAETNIKIAEVEKENMVTTKIKKKVSDKQLIARKDGYSPTPFMLELYGTSFSGLDSWWTWVRERCSNGIIL